MNKLNVFYNIRDGCKNPIKIVLEFFRRLKYAFQRVTRGFSDYDIIDMDVFYKNIVISTIKEFSKTTQTYPPDMVSIGQWKSYLNKISDDLEYAYSSSDDENEYSDEFNKIIKYHVINGDLKDNKNELGELYDKYYDRFFEIENKHKNVRDKAYIKLYNILDKLWL